MRIKITIPGKEANKFKEKLLKIVEKVEEEKRDEFDFTMVCF